MVFIVVNPRVGDVCRAFSCPRTFIAKVPQFMTAQVINATKGVKQDDIIIAYVIALSIIQSFEVLTHYIGSWVRLDLEKVM